MFRRCFADGLRLPSSQAFSVRSATVRPASRAAARARAEAGRCASGSFKTGLRRAIETGRMTERTFTPAMGRYKPFPPGQRQVVPGRTRGQPRTSLKETSAEGRLGPLPLREAFVGGGTTRRGPASVQTFARIMSADRGSRPMTGTAARCLYLTRHGEASPDESSLTDNGRRQACSRPRRPEVALDGPQPRRRRARRHPLRTRPARFRALLQRPGAPPHRTSLDRLPARPPRLRAAEGVSGPVRRGGCAEDNRRHE